MHLNVLHYNSYKIPDASRGFFFTAIYVLMKKEI